MRRYPLVEKGAGLLAALREAVAHATYVLLQQHGAEFLEAGRGIVGARMIVSRLGIVSESTFDW